MHPPVPSVAAREGFPSLQARKEIRFPPSPPISCLAARSFSRLNEIRHYPSCSLPPRSSPWSSSPLGSIHQRRLLSRPIRLPSGEHESSQSDGRGGEGEDEVERGRRRWQKGSDDEDGQQLSRDHSLRSVNGSSKKELMQQKQCSFVLLLIATLKKLHLS